MMGNIVDKNTFDLTEGSISKNILRFFFPVVIGTLFQQLYNTVDAIIVGQFVGTEALAAVGGSTAQLINLVVGFFVGLASGAMVTISQYYGAGEKVKLQDTVHTAIAFCVVAGAFLTLIGELFSPFALRLMLTPENTMQDSVLYLRIYFSGTIPLMLFNIGSGILRAVGDSKRPLYYLIACCGLNIILDIVFVTVFHMGVAGVALATMLALFVSAGLVMLNLCTTDALYHVSVRQVRMHREPLGKMLTIGIPCGIQSMMFSLSNSIIQSVVNKFGSDVVAAWTTTNKWDGIFWSVSNSFGATITAFTGQAIGAGKYDKMHESVRTCMKMAMTVSAVMTVLLLVFGRYGFRIFTRDEVVVTYALRMMFCFVPFYCIWTVIEILTGVLHGAGDAVWPAIIITIGTCGLRVVWCYFIVPLYETIESVSLCYPVSWFITALAFLVYYFKSDWMHRCIEKAKR